VYASFLGGIEYRGDVDTSFWDPGSVDISGVMDIVAHIEYKVVHDDKVICISI
jgi:hypothetical protein